MAGDTQPHQLTAVSGGTLYATLSQLISSSAAPVPLEGGIFIGEGLQPVPSKLADELFIIIHSSHVAYDLVLIACVDYQIFFVS